MRLILDRFEEGNAICEDMDTRDTSVFPAESLPEGASPGDVLLYDGGGFKIDRSETGRRRKRIKKMFKDLRG